MHPHSRSILLALRALLARAGGMAALSAVVAGALALAPVRPVQASEIYRYKDPYGVWRAMKVPTGYAKYYKRAQARTVWRGNGIKACLDCPRRRATAHGSPRWH